MARADRAVPSTVDACDPATGAIAHAPQDSACPSGQTCSASLGCQTAAAACGALQPVAGTAIRLQPLTSGLSSPVHAAAPRGEASRVFVIEQAGRVRLVKNGRLQAAPWLDLTAQVLCDCSERGLPSVAFHPAFASNGRAYLYFTVLDPAADVAGAGATL